MSPRTALIRMATVFCAVLLALASSLSVAQQTAGLFTHSAGSVDSGYVLFPAANGTTYLIDKCGHLAHTWVFGGQPNQSAYLLKDGSVIEPLLYSGGGLSAGGMIVRLSWDGQILWKFAVADSTNRQHHDIYPLPNGNVLVLAQDIHSKAEVSDNGRDSSLLTTSLQSEQIIELQPVGKDSAIIVWRWRVWDHLIQDREPTKAGYGSVGAHPELIDLNYPSTLQLDLKTDDWLHANGISYNPELDQVIFSSHNFNEIWVIDHGTTANEAASHAGGRRGKGGDLLYRWGNPAAYRHGTVNDQKLFGQHSPTWIPRGYPYGGRLIVFNNGVTRPGTKYSTVEILSPPIDPDGNYDTSTFPYLPAAQDWIYTATPPRSLFTPSTGGAQMLSSGNVLVCNGGLGTFFEIDTAQRTVWQYVSPVTQSGPVAQGSATAGNSTFRCTFYPCDYPAFNGRSIPSGAPIELNPLPYTCTLDVDTVLHGESGIQAAVPADLAIPLYPNPAYDRLHIGDGKRIDAVALYSMLGTRVFESVGAQELSVANLPAGIYRLVARIEGRSSTGLVTIVK